MWPSSYFSPVYWSPAYWPPGGVPVPPTGHMHAQITLDNPDPLLAVSRLDPTEVWAAPPPEVTAAPSGTSTSSRGPTSASQRRSTVAVGPGGHGATTDQRPATDIEVSDD